MRKELKPNKLWVITQRELVFLSVITNTAGEFEKRIVYNNNVYDVPMYGIPNNTYLNAYELDVQSSDVRFVCKSIIIIIIIKKK